MRQLSASRVAAVLAALAVTTLGAAVRPAGAQSVVNRPSTSAPPPGWSRGERWQAAMHDGSYLWELAPTSLRGDTLLARQADTTVRVPLEHVDELRLVRASVKRVGGGARSTFGGLAGADDAVFTLARYSLAERRRIVSAILAEEAAERSGDSTATPAAPKRP